MTKPRILIVEDDQDWEDVYRRALRGADYEIISTRKVDTAMALLEEQSFEIVITDLKMLGKEGEFSGFGVLERARTIDPNVQVIVITGYGSADHALRAMSNGAYDYITKGKDLCQKLALSVQSALEIRELHQEWLNNKFDNDLDVQAGRIIGNSASMQSLNIYAPKFVNTDQQNLTRYPRTVGAKDPKTILQVCPLNLGGCSKREEIMRLYSPHRVFVNVPDMPEYEEYEQIIRHTLEAYSLAPVLPKDYLEPVIMICNICKLIQTCKYSITDISLSETNVLYRLGQMHAAGLHCAIFKDRRAKCTVELQGLFLLEYSNPKSLAAQLERWIENQVSEAKKPVVDMAQTEMDLPPAEERASLQRQLVHYKRNLLKLQEHRTDFIDPRSVPLDIQKNETLLKREIVRIQHRLIAAI